MTLVFENELHDMTAAMKEYLRTEDPPFYITGHVQLEEVPYYGCRTDIAAVRIDPYALARRARAVGHMDPLPDERKYRKSYRALQQIEPVTRDHWIHEDGTYHTEQTCREVWDWMAENGFLTPVEDAELGMQQTIGGGVKAVVPYDDVPCVTVKVPDVIRVHAFELKQRDWRTALHQAERQDCYAEHRSVVMDAGKVDDALEHKKKFRDSGVGLASLDRDGFEIHLKPKRNTPPKTPVRQLVAGRALDRAPESVLEEARDHV